MKAAKVALYNQTVVGLPMSVMIFCVMKWRGCSCSPADMPTFPWSVVEVTIFTLVEEIGFYYTHRLVDLQLELVI